MEKTLINFGGIFGINPFPIVADAGGNVFETTLTGGKNNFGLVFEIPAEGAPAILHEFTGTADGGAPLAGLLLGPSGILYGTAAAGGKNNGGVVFELQLPELTCSLDIRVTVSTGGGTSALDTFRRSSPSKYKIRSQGLLKRNHLIGLVFSVRPVNSFQ